ncbi:class I SAM-dependent methyltransferase [Kribbella italica]|uniref:Protein-L-isoaspartate O-methyltransferase n=1 Tax=Kribbella italica TaxID=1540520 RepID=A0A7W9MZB7_9ACTN|nr:class I SAM-dependent methyltransferase [Kribbella italica]MBB5841038.1 protein-L-isoaspartate O-methyltransferase [Kribbella italica]
MNDLTEYYRRRAGEYDAVYAKPERQDDLRRLRSAVVELVDGLRVLEVAAGTGYWTAVMAPAARSVLATDLAEETLAVARERSYSGDVSFQAVDVAELDTVGGEYDVVFAGFFWSHVPRADAAEFVRRLGRRGRRVVLVDNLYVEGSSSPVTSTGPGGDTYQTRRLADGSSYEILKNFPAAGNVEADLRAVGSEIRFESFEYYWLATVAVS